MTIKTSNSILCLASLSLLLALACNSKTGTGKKMDCSSLKSGRFRYQSELSGDIYTVERGEPIQIETNEMTGDMSYWRITWTGPCEYEGKNLDDSINYPDPILFKVIRQESKYYIFEATRKGANRVITDTLFRIK